jgi:hypothetical protein
MSAAEYCRKCGLYPVGSCRACKLEAENKWLREALVWIEQNSLCCPYTEKNEDGHQDDCPVALALDPQRNEATESRNDE